MSFLYEFSFPEYNLNVEPTEPYFNKNILINFENPFRNNFPTFEENIEEKSISKKTENYFNILEDKKTILVETKNDLKKDFFPNESSLEKKEKILNDPVFNNNNDLNEFTNIFDVNRNFPEEKKLIFEVIFPKKDYLSINIEKNPGLIKEEKTFLRRKRLPKTRGGKDRLDNIRVRIKRQFLNTALINKLNETLLNIGINIKLNIFPDNLVKDINKKRNKIIFNMTLEEFMTKKILYIYNNDKNSLQKYEYNLKILENEDVKNNEEFKKILDKKISELYEEYMNSDKFKKEINRLKNAKKENDEYINTYIYLAGNLLKFFFSN